MKQTPRRPLCGPVGLRQCRSQLLNREIATFGPHWLEILVFFLVFLGIPLHLFLSDQCPANVVMPVFWIGGANCFGLVGQRLIAQHWQQNALLHLNEKTEKEALDVHQFPVISVLIVATCRDLASSRHLQRFAMLSQLSSQWCLRKLVISKLKNIEAEAKLCGPENPRKVLMYRPRMPQDIIRQQRQRRQR